MNILDPLAPYIGAIKAVGVVVAVIAVFAFGVKIGSGDVQAKWDKAEVARAEAEKKALAERLAENAAEKARQDTEAKTLKKGYEDEIKKVRSDAASAASRGLRINAAICNSFAGKANTESTSRSNEGTPATGILPEPYSTNLIELMRQADEAVAGCRVAQQFLIRNGMAP